jgi:CheY-like chemotaxis protein
MRVADVLQGRLLNLIGNAVKFTTRGGITLRCERRASGETVIDVSDTGEGIPPNRIEAIFNPFEQLDSSDGRRHGGTGLGLTISRELARAMGGDLACVASSEAGSTFRLSLSLPDSAPLADLHDPLARVPEWPAARVLLVEDNPVNALVAGATLDKLGLRYVQADDGEQALQQVMAPGAQAFDLILMDCQMPGMDGFEATRRIRDHELQQALRRCPIVALTASAQPGDRQRSLQAGMDDHLAKPFTEDELVATLRRHLPAEG